MFELVRQGGWSVIVMIIMSIVALAVIIDRTLYLVRFSVDREGLLDDLADALRRGGIEEAVSVASAYRGPVARVVRHALVASQQASPGELLASLERMKALQMDLLEKRLYLLGTIGATAPFVGLFGTVLGILKAFADIAATGDAGIAVVGAGVSEALIATAVGLFAAIPATIAYNFFVGTQLRALATAVDLFGAQFQDDLKRVALAVEPAPVRRAGG